MPPLLLLLLSRAHTPAAAAAPSDATATTASATWSQPQPGLKFEYKLNGAFDPASDYIAGVQLYLIDGWETPAAAVAALRARGAGIYPVCYFSAGSREDWRPDAGAYGAADVGGPLEVWPGERWVDVRSANVRTILDKVMRMLELFVGSWSVGLLGRGMHHQLKRKHLPHQPIILDPTTHTNAPPQRIKMCKDKGFLAVDPDNVDGFANDNGGLNFTATDQLIFNRWLADTAHSYGLAAGLKNDVGQVAELEPYFDFFVNEE